jgi:multidrug efflux pump subunit AcrA (membrane-fusion protein)
MDVTEEKLLLPSRKESRLNSEPAKRRGPRLWLFVLVLIFLTGAMFLFGWSRHHRVDEEVNAAASHERATLPVVNVAKIKRAPDQVELLLPGNITPLTEAYVYARASGYVKKRYVDIGDRVREGQLLAEIDSPDLDSQVAQGRASLLSAEGQAAQARAQLDNQQANLSLARVTAERYTNLLKKGAVARQDTDQQVTNFHANEASVRAAQSYVTAADENVRAARANLDRLVTLQEYEKVRAPFAGVITARNFDIGALVSNSGSTQGASASNGGTQGAAGAALSSGASSATPATGSLSGGELYRVADFRTLRILINVPQESAPSIQLGQQGVVLIREFPSRKFIGRIARTSSSVDVQSRTMLAEVHLANPQMLLMPGMYAEVRVTSATPNPPLLAPGDGIMTNSEGLRVATLEDLNQPGAPAGAKRIHMVRVQVGRDFGQEIEILSGLQGWEYVVVNPSDAVREGAIVQPVTAAIKPVQPPNGTHKQ